MPNFSGKLNANEIFGSLFNMIISQEVFSDNIKGDDLVDKARVDGTLFGDTKLYYASDALATSEWGNDVEAQDLLKLHRPAAPECQAIVLNQFRQVSLTVDQYLSKRAWMNEGAFTSFNSAMETWMNDTKKVHCATLYNAYIGTTTGASNKANIEIPLSDVTATGVEGNKLKGELIAQHMADLLSDMTDYNRDYNDYKYLRRYSPSEVKFIWNSKFVNMIRYTSVPEIFHKEGIDLVGDSLPARYFGEVNTDATNGDGTKVRSLIEQVIGDNHYFAGDLIDTSDTAPAGTSYTQDDDVICKVVVKLPPFMSAFSVATDFFNPKSLTDNKYLTFGYNTLEYFKAYPFLTVHAD